MQAVLISQEILNLAKNPERIWDVDSLRFEQIIAELLAGQGYRVQLPPPTRDGGYDIMALHKDPLGIETTTLVECKKYMPEHKVSISTVRGLYGVKSYLGVSNALLVTTSSYTSDSRKFVESKYDIQLFDFSDLKRWIEEYIPPLNLTPYSEEKAFKSCFISHSSKDKVFVEKLNSTLREAGIRVWYAPEDLLPGQKLREQIKKAIRSFDKLLLVLSENSMKSDWVTTEIRDAKHRERDEGHQVLFPISIVPMGIVQEWECFDSDTGRDLAVDIREFFVPDLSDWENPIEYEKQVQRLLMGLRTGGNS